jgi:hypothetical protein
MFARLLCARDLTKNFYLRILIALELAIDLVFKIFVALLILKIFILVSIMIVKEVLGFQKFFENAHFIENVNIIL